MNKRFFKIFILTVLIILMLFQLYPKPPANFSTTAGASDVSGFYHTSPDLQMLLKKSCYDCHSNNTIYPWYSQVQPVALWLGNHINEGKSALNFNLFGDYPVKRKYKKLEEISDEVKQGEMPLSSYTLIHRNAVLNKKEQLIIENWAQSMMDSITVNYPSDSLR